MHVPLTNYPHAHASISIMSKVIVVGCGVTGLVVALLLQKKGYKPVIVEKQGEVCDNDGTLLLQPIG